MATDINTLINKKKIQMITIQNKSRQDYPISFDINKNAKEVYVYFEDLQEDDIKKFIFEKNGTQLKITNGNQIYRIKDYFTSKDGTATKSVVTTIMYDDGNGGYVYKNIINEGYINTANYDTEIDYISKINKKGVVTGTVFSDEMDFANALENPLNSKNKGLTINGGKGNDVITGSKFNDTIDGGAGTTTYNYDFGKTSGLDTIKLNKGETLILNLTNDETPLACEDVNYGNGKIFGYSNDLFIYKDDMSNMIRIKNFFKTTATVKIGDENLKEFLVSDDFEGIYLSGKGKLTGTIYNDIITGSDKNDTITAKAGNDTIYTSGGKDTVVETGVYGHDIIDGSLSSKVTVKLSTFNANNFDYGTDDLTYTTDNNSSFVYSDFVSGETADLWVKAGNKSYHVLKDSSASVDYSKNKNNNVLFLNGENQEFIGSKKGINTIYSLDGENKYTLQGVNDTVVDTGSDNDSYTATLTKSSKFVINDDGGEDTLTLNNNISDLVLFYNIDSEGNTDDDLIICNKKAMSYSALTKAVKNDSYTGGVKLENYFSEGAAENINAVFGTENIDLDMQNWKYEVNTYVADWLKDKNFNSVKDVFLSGTKSQKKELTTYFKTLSYEYYLQELENSAKYSEISFVNNNSVLEIYKDITNEDGKVEKILLYPPISGFLSDDETKIQSFELMVKDDNDRFMTISINSKMEVSYNLGNDNIVTFDSNAKYSDISFVNEGTVLYIKNADKTLYTVNNFVSDTDSQNILLNVLDDNENKMSISLDSLMNKEYNMAGENQITYNDDFSDDNTLRITDNSSNTLIFKNKDYIDFYTKGELSGSYDAGDPLIKKDYDTKTNTSSDDLLIGDVTVKNTDGLNAQIQLVDKENKTKNIIIGSDTINGTHESEIIIGSNGADIINSNGNNDLIYMGDGKDILNLTSTTGDETGKNTAEMIGIGGTHPISNNLDVPAISVYSGSGDDTYNTTLKDFGLYIEDYAGNDTLNIKYSDNNLMYFFDVINPNHEGEEGITFYSDLMICDKTQFMSAGLTALGNMQDGMGMKDLMQSMQGSFGYAWIDDHFGETQEIENINIIDGNNNSTDLDIDTEIASTKEKIANWLAGTYKGSGGMYGVNGDYDSAWDVIEKGTGADKKYLALIYTNNEMLAPFIIQNS